MNLSNEKKKKKKETRTIVSLRSSIVLHHCLSKKTLYTRYFIEMEIYVTRYSYLFSLHVTFITSSYIYIYIYLDTHQRQFALALRWNKVNRRFIVEINLHPSFIDDYYIYINRSLNKLIRHGVLRNWRS